jgi:hypothetical protein
MFIREKNLILNTQNIETIRELPASLVEVVMVSGRVHTLSHPKLKRRLLNQGRGRLLRLIRWVLRRK